MNLQQKQKLEKVIEQLSKNAVIGGWMKPETMVSYWNNAVQYNKIQNDYLKHNEGEEVVRHFSCKDTDINQVVRVNVKAKKNYSRIEWFTILAACDYYFYTCKEMKELIATFKK